MTQFEALMLDKRRVRTQFDAAAASYVQSAVLQAEVRRRLLERLQWILLNPEHILDAGSGPGEAIPGLVKRFKKARVTALDCAPAMLARIGRTAGWWRRPARVCADLEQMPLAPASVDLVFSNLTLQWCNQPDAAFAEMRRVLRPEGLVMFTTLGPDTLGELRTAWRQVDAHPHVSTFIDMHDIGDALVRAGFADPVMDREMITLTYEQVRDLLADLRGIGAVNATQGRRRGLTTPRQLKALEAAYEGFRDEQRRLPASYEVIYGHAWVPDAPPPGTSRPFIPIRSEN
ncbi:malonyl-CoA O-methyltransferase [Ectothiorhodosinus mongolicus]|uniref:Malonyl-[acyl-carrier protein] O-methyltransferase n=1 Tax=Ectothiorhodosinus mongolicus TaxID=233100 RepID=A0A1R3VWA4_9GAMM|nr:malonyl-ACP O-methyltransferase BioC [Ectothiorhodosinus mongolicus]ULX56858.1 malonyl-[acyl-carrier protein] O-methyltransferase BioC [Ectothiorhodosinus mongolicus]SIT68687.1 malonyl-CoA O-methyltransferase [Ectothiorhodosinus mongolicus]